MVSRDGSVGKESTCNAGDASWIPGLERSPGGGHGNPLQYPCLENPMDRGAWWNTVHTVAKSCTWLKQLSMHHIFIFLLAPSATDKKQAGISFRPKYWSQCKTLNLYCGLISCTIMQYYVRRRVKRKNLWTNQILILNGLENGLCCGLFSL